MTKISIRNLQEADCETISAAFTNQGWNKPITRYYTYLAEQNLGIRLVILAFVDNLFAGYLTILWNSYYLYFSENQIPEIADLNVLIQYQGHKVATQLMDYAEELVFAKSKKIGLGAGMTKDYGKAQRMYVRRGYVPDGNGMIHNNKILKYGDTITVDDDLVLYFVKNSI